MGLIDLSLRGMKPLTENDILAYTAPKYTRGYRGRTKVFGEMSPNLVYWIVVCIFGFFIALFSGAIVTGIIWLTNIDSWVSMMDSMWRGRLSEMQVPLGQGFSSGD